MIAGSDEATPDGEAREDAGPDAVRDAGSDEADCPWFGCDDCCCAQENGGLLFCGGCGCHGYACECCRRGRSYDCETAEFLEPGAAAPRDVPGIGWSCEPLRDSFWYQGPVVPAPPVLDPCPADTPCCREASYPVGFATVDTTGEPHVVPLDTSALPALGWGCRDTGCEVFCEPPEGSIVAVHLRAGDAGIENPAAASSYAVQEVCSP